MFNKHLPNYLRAFRKRSGLSQDEMAFLLGCESGKTVSRYERFSRQPDLRAALTYEVVCAAPVRELFEGTFQQVEMNVSRNAQLLLEKLTTAERDAVMAQKVDALTRLLEE